MSNRSFYRSIETFNVEEHIEIVLSIVRLIFKNTLWKIHLFVNTFSFFLSPPLLSSASIFQSILYVTCTEKIDQSTGVL